MSPVAGSGRNRKDDAGLITAQADCCRYKLFNTGGLAAPVRKYSGLNIISFERTDSTAALLESVRSSSSAAGKCLRHVSGTQRNHRVRVFFWQHLGAIPAGSTKRDKISAAVQPLFIKTYLF